MASLKDIAHGFSYTLFSGYFQMGGTVVSETLSTKANEVFNKKESFQKFLRTFNKNEIINFCYSYRNQHGVEWMSRGQKVSNNFYSIPM